MDIELTIDDIHTLVDVIICVHLILRVLFSKNGHDDCKSGKKCVIL
jgi:hypothetical protein